MGYGPPHPPGNPLFPPGMALRLTLIEIAAETLDLEIAARTRAIRDEGLSPAPDAAKIGELEREIDDLDARHHGLRPDDDRSILDALRARRTAPPPTGERESDRRAAGRKRVPR